MSNADNASWSEPEPESDVLRPGTTLLTCEPLVYAGFIQTPELPFCDNCLTIKTQGLLRCMSCHVIRYCNRTCLEKAWKDGHMYECKGMHQLIRSFERAPRPLRCRLIWAPRILIRLLLKLQDGADHFDEVEIGGNKVKLRFMDLVSHYEEIRDDEGFMEIIGFIIHSLKTLLESCTKPKIKMPTDPELIDIYGRVHANMSEIVHGMHTVAGGLYLASSILKHSCIPTATRKFKGTTMSVLSITEIPKSLPMDQVTVTFIDTLLPSNDRRERLKRNYHVHCECERCQTGQFDSEMRSIVCPNSDCNAKIDTENMRNPCDICGHIMNEEAIAEVLQLENYANNLLRVHIIDLGRIESCIEKMKGKFSDSHWLMLDLISRAFDVAQGTRNMEKTYEYGSKFITEIRGYHPPISETLVRILLKVCLSATELGKSDEAKQYIAEANSMVKVLHGPLAKVLVLPLKEFSHIRNEKTSNEDDASGPESDVLRPGTILLTNEPFVFAGLIQFPELPFCDTCLIINGQPELPRCVSCKVVRYCNRTCQEKGWKNGHRYECKGLKKLVQKFEAAPSELNPKLIWGPRILLRLLLKLQVQDGTDNFDELEFGGSKVKLRFSDLVSHYEVMGKNKEAMEAIRQIVQNLKGLLGPKSKIKIPTDAELIELYGRIHANASDIGDGFLTPACGLYLVNSILHHSCSPIAKRMYKGTTMYVRSITEVSKELPVDKITVSLIDTLMPSQNRREKLKMVYNFNCECERCETGQFDKEMRSIICPNRNCNAKIDHENMWDPCDVCGHVMTEEALDKVEKSVNYMVELLDVPGLDLQHFEACIEMMKGTFADSHCLMIQLFRRAYNAAQARFYCTDEGELKQMKRQKSYEYGSKFISEVRRYLQPYDDELLHILVDVAWFAFELGKFDEAEKYILEAISIAEVLHGEDSGYARSRIYPLQNKLGEVKMIRDMKQLGIASSQKKK